MITPSLIYKFPSLKYCLNESVPFLFLFAHAVSADIVMLKNSLDNVALFRVDNFPQHINAVHVFFSFSLKHYRSTVAKSIWDHYTGKDQKLVDPFYPTILLLSLSAACPAKQPLSREIRTLHQVYPINYKLFGHIYIIIYMSRKQRFLRSTVQYGTGDIFFMRSYLHHPDIDGHLLRRYVFLCGDIYIICPPRNGYFGEAQASQGH